MDTCVHPDLLYTHSCPGPWTKTLSVLSKAAYCAHACKSCWEQGQSEPLVERGTSKEHFPPRGSTGSLCSSPEPSPCWQPGKHGDLWNSWPREGVSERQCGQEGLMPPDARLSGCLAATPLLCHMFYPPQLLPAQSFSS